MIQMHIKMIAIHKLEIENLALLESVQ